MLKIYTPNTRDSIVNSFQYQTLSTMFDIERESFDDINPDTIFYEIETNQAVIMANDISDYRGLLGSSHDSDFYRSIMMSEWGEAYLYNTKRSEGGQLGYIGDGTIPTYRDTYPKIGKKIKDLGEKNGNSRIIKKHNPDGFPMWIGPSEVFHLSEQYSENDEYIVVELPEGISVIERHYVIPQGNRYLTRSVILYSRVEDPYRDIAQKGRVDIAATANHYFSVCNTTDFRCAAFDVAYVSGSHESTIIGVFSPQSIHMIAGDAHMVRQWLKMSSLIFLDSVNEMPYNYRINR